MTNEQKTQVRAALLHYVNNFETPAQAAASLYGVSVSTLSLIRNERWELLSDDLWLHIAHQVGCVDTEWKPADTGAYLLLRILCGDAQHYRMTYGIAIASGLGKTFTAHHYTRENADTFYMAGNEYYNRKSFMAALLNSAGQKAKGTVPEMMQQFADFIRDRDEPLFILDDAHKLKDRVLHMAVILANSVLGSAGIVIMGDDRLRSRIMDGVNAKRVGYDEIYKSIGRRFISLGSLGPNDVALVCRANNICDEEVIAAIKEECNNNLHHATRLINQAAHYKIAA